MKRLKLFLPLIAFAGVCAFLYQGLQLEPSKLPSALLGKPFPEFVLTALRDETKPLGRGDVVGKVALVNVWATWCPSCRVEHHFLNEIVEKFGVVIYGVNYKDERDKAQQWLENLGNPYRLSIYDDTGSLGIDLGVYGAPETYVIDHNGMIRYKHVGVVDMRVWEQTLQPIVLELEAVALASGAGMAE